MFIYRLLIAWIAIREVYCKQHARRHQNKCTFHIPFLNLFPQIVLPILRRYAIAQVTQLRRRLLSAVSRSRACDWPARMKHQKWESMCDGIP